MMSIDVPLQNKIIQKWVRQFCSEQREFFVTICGKNANLFLLVSEVEGAPIGLGQDEFFIDKGFVMKVNTLIASLG